MKKRYGTTSFIIKFTSFSLILATAAIILGGTVIPASSSGVDGTPVKIIVDAGHGGLDGGAVADDGTVEKDLNLSLAHSLKNALIALGADVIMTRSDDVMLADDDSPHKKRDDLNVRAKLARESGDCIFVSIHMNKFPVPKYSGLQVYYSPKNEQSKAIADALQAAARQYIDPANARVPKKAGEEIYLMQNVTCPAVLVECGFLSNPTELERLKDAAYREKLALIIAATLMEYASVADARE